MSASKHKIKYHFHQEYEEEFIVIMYNEKCINANLSIPKKHLEPHFLTVYKGFDLEISVGNGLR